MSADNYNSGGECPVCSHPYTEHVEVALLAEIDHTKAEQVKTCVKPGLDSENDPTVRLYYHLREDLP